MQIRTVVEEVQLRSHVEFVRFVECNRKTSHYRITDLLVLPTSQENFGLVFPEAMACRVPVITTRGVDIWPELEESGGALIIEEDVASIAAAIIQLLDDATQRKQMGEAGRTWVGSTFTGDAVVNRYTDLYRKAINR